MAIKKRDGSYKCFFCDFKDKSPMKVQAHIDTTHEYVVLPIQVSDLNRLLQFIYLKDDSLLNPELINVIKYYLRIAVRRGTHTMEDLENE
jgi:hypothetical protein